MIILGGGAIALEFAHFYNALGTKVTVLQRSAQFMKDADLDVSTALIDAYRGRGAEMISGAQLVAVEKNGDGKTVRFVKDGLKQAITAEEIFYALGRRPAIGRLQVNTAGIETNEDVAIRINDRMQSSQPHIFAAGDAAGQFEVVHIAIEQAMVATRNAARLLKDEQLKSIDYRLRLSVIFSHPELAYVGLTESEARAEGRQIRVATHPFNDHGRSLVRGEIDGLVKLIADANTHEIVGGAVLGIEASELAAIPHYHPTLSEIWTYPAEELAAFE